MESCTTGSRALFLLLSLSFSINISLWCVLKQVPQGVSQALLEFQKSNLLERSPKISRLTFDRLFCSVHVLIKPYFASMISIPLAMMAFVGIEQNKRSLFPSGIFESLFIFEYTLHRPHLRKRKLFIIALTLCTNPLKRGLAGKKASTGFRSHDSRLLAIAASLQSITSPNRWPTSRELFRCNYNHC